MQVHRINNDYFRYWGKAKPTSEGPPLHLLPFHCLDVAATGIEYLRRTPALTQTLMQELGIQEVRTLERWVGFWLSAHDLGKFSEAFQSQRADHFENLKHRLPNPSKPYKLRHDSLGMIFWKRKISDYAVAQTWFGPGTQAYERGLDWWPRAVTGHHGQPPQEGLEHNWTSHFVQEDFNAAVSFLEDARILLLGSDFSLRSLFQDVPHFEQTSCRLSWWIAGLAVLADWVGSNTDFFPYDDQPQSLGDYWGCAQARARTALSQVGLQAASAQPTQAFSALFPRIIEPSPLQAWAAKVELPTRPQIHLLEDVTGAGKTEAALMLTHRLVASGCADGFFIGLPTMATANAMYGRMADVYRKLFEGPATLGLAHGRRELVELFASSIVTSGPAQADEEQQDETATARCTAWLADHNKRSLLCDAGVGTIDQALLAVLQSKHQSLRMLGLFRKVLVVDEVHACDAYMQGVLGVLLEFHARAGGSAILLSATLPQRMKQALLGSFAKGLKGKAPNVLETAYPLVTSWPTAAEDIMEEPIATRSDVHRTVKVHYTSVLDEVVETIEAALRNGQCVCWMRNTVGDALRAYDIFRNRVAADKLTLFHARFALKDRLDTETAVLENFGKDSTPDQRRGRLVIATQVAEQSLDADWDFVVSDLAPIDRLIQRAGRLQRHRRDPSGARCATTAADGRGVPVLWVFGPPWTATPGAGWFKDLFPQAGFVYPHHGQLWLTARLLQEAQFTMPTDARRFIEAVFGDEEIVPEGLQRNANEAEGTAYGDASQAQQNTVKLAHGYLRSGIDWWSEAKTPSRLGEETIEVLLARWQGNTLHPWASHANEHSAWAYSTIRIAEHLIGQSASPINAERQIEYNRVLATLPNNGKWSVLLALDECSSGWVGQSMVPKKGDAVLKTWIYQTATGLVENWEVENPSSP